LQSRKGRGTTNFRLSILGRAQPCPKSAFLSPPPVKVWLRCRCPRCTHLKLNEKNLTSDRRGLNHAGAQASWGWGQGTGHSTNQRAGPLSGSSSGKWKELYTFQPHHPAAEPDLFPPFCLVAPCGSCPEERKARLGDTGLSMAREASHGLQ